MSLPSAADPLTVEEAKQRLLNTPDITPIDAIKHAAREHLVPAAIAAAGTGLVFTIIPKRTIARTIARFGMPLAAEVIRRIWA
jgi:hypothetical protein